MKRKTIVALVGGAALVFALGSSAAFAGERTGTGTKTAGPEHAASLCVFSGLEDFDGEGDLVEVEPGVTQNWGQIVKVAGPLGGANDVEFVEEGCNAHLYPNEDAD